MTQCNNWYTTRKVLQHQCSEEWCPLHKRSIHDIENNAEHVKIELSGNFNFPMCIATLVHDGQNVKIELSVMCAN